MLLYKRIDDGEWGEEAEGQAADAAAGSTSSTGGLNKRTYVGGPAAPIAAQLPRVINLEN